MALYKHAHVEWYIEMFHQVGHALLFGLAAAIGEKDEGNTV